MARPASPAVQSLVNRQSPQLFATVGAWLSAEIRAGRIRDLPLPLLISQFLAPIVMQMLLRPALSAQAYLQMPGIEQTCDVFADAFIRAVATNPA